MFSLRFGPMTTKTSEPTSDDPRLLRLDSRDNVLCVAQPLSAGDEIAVAGRSIVIAEPLTYGAKLASQPIPAETPVVKSGVPIGIATRDIQPGELAHVHNVRGDYLPTYGHATQATYFGRTDAAPKPSE